MGFTRPPPATFSMESIGINSRRSHPRPCLENPRKIVFKRGKHFLPGGIFFALWQIQERRNSKMRAHLGSEPGPKACKTKPLGPARDKDPLKLSLPPMGSPFRLQEIPEATFPRGWNGFLQKTIPPPRKSRRGGLVLGFPGRFWLQNGCFLRQSARGRPPGEILL